MSKTKEELEVEVDRLCGIIESQENRFRCLHEKIVLQLNQLYSSCSIEECLESLFTILQHNREAIRDKDNQIQDYESDIAFLRSQVLEVKARAYDILERQLNNE